MSKQHFIIAAVISLIIVIIASCSTRIICTNIFNFIGSEKPYSHSYVWDFVIFICVFLWLLLNGSGADDGDDD